jgi:hypothetical protein
MPDSKCLGKKPARGDARTLNFARFVQLDRVPKAYDPWKTRAPFPARSFGNTSLGDCTRASQAIAAMRFERIETRATPQITDDEVRRVYREGCRRHYGTTDDVGMYEVDALSDFRKPEYTFKDTHGRPITIDAFTQVNVRDREEVKAAIALSGKFGIKICLNLPLAYSRIEPPDVWDVPADGKFTGDWEPGSWGGHSLFADAYDARGIRLCHSWFDGAGVEYHQWLTWSGLSAFADESYWIVDSIDAWRKRPPSQRAAVDLTGIVKAVNRVSSHRITA